MLLFRSSLSSRRAISVIVTVAVGLVSSLPSSNAFLFEGFKEYGGLQDLANSLKTDCQLNIRLDIGNGMKPNMEHGGPSPRMALNGLQLELSQEMAAKGEKHVPLPGSSGPHPKTSSGARTLRVDQLPSFIGMNGMESVPLEQAAWEMVWRDGCKSGILICGFECPNTVSRNDATLPAGRVYMSFPIWTPELLAEQQLTRDEAEKNAAEYTVEKNEMLRRYAETDNILMKAIHYRNAAAAVEKIDMTCVHFYRHIPDSNNVVRIHDGLLMSTKGSCYSIAKDFFKKKTLLGEAVVQLPQQQNCDDSDDSTNKLLRP